GLLADAQQRARRGLGRALDADAVNERPVGRTEISDQKVLADNRQPAVSPRDFGIRKHDLGGRNPAKHSPGLRHDVMAADIDAVNYFEIMNARVDERRKRFSERANLGLIRFPVRHATALSRNGYMHRGDGTSRG